jgi:hypothetical protein
MRQKFINFNIDTNFKNQKIIVIILRKVYGELDWMIPIITELNKDYTIIAIIENSNYLKLLKKNKFLYNLFVQNFHGAIVENKINELFFRSFLKVCKIFLSKNYYNQILEKSTKWYYAVQEIIDLIRHNFNLKNLESLNVFVSYDNLFNNWENQIRKNYSIKTFYFPSSCSLKPKVIDIKNIQIKKEKNKYLLISNYLDSNYWEDFYPQLTQHVVGYPRFSKNWIKNFRNSKKENDTIRVYLSYRDLSYLGSPWFKKSIIQLQTIIKNLHCLEKNFEIVVKTHPHTDQNKIKKFLKDEKKIKYIFSDQQQQEICKDCRFSINFYGSASIMDSLSTNTSAVEMWKLSEDDIQSPYKEYKLSFYVQNEEEFKDTIKGFVNNDNLIEKASEEKFKIFEKLCQNTNSVLLFRQILS